MHKIRAKSNQYNKNIDKRGSEDVKTTKLIVKEGNSAAWVVGLLMFAVVGGILLQALGFLTGDTDGVNELS